MPQKRYCKTSPNLEQKHKMSDRSLDRLALVSKLILDERVVALRKENELLQLQLFWKDHSKSKLKKLMKKANRSGGNAPLCNCNSCTFAGRSVQTGQASECSFKPWFEKLLAACKLTHVTGVSIGMEPVGTHMSCDCGNLVFDADAHFHHITEADWWMWMYGAKLWKARSVNDPELGKLMMLFKALEAEIYGPDE